MWEFSLSVLRGALDFLSDTGSFFKTILATFWVAFLLPVGLLLTIFYGGWLYFGPFLVANVLIAYKLNKARRSERQGAYDDKSFGSSVAAMDFYAENFMRSHQSSEDS
jgi:hypothetical protein